MSNEWESSKGSGEVWNPKKDADGNQIFKPINGNDHLDGYLISQKDDIGEHKSTVYTFEDKDTGKRVDVWGDIVLDKELAVIRKGTYIRIQWHGRQFKKAFANSGPKVLFTSTNSFNNWEVFTNKNVPPLDIASNDGFESAPTKDVAQAAPIAKGATAGVDFGAKVAKDTSDGLPF